MTSLPRRHLLTSAAGVAGASSILAACGDSSSDSAPDTPTPSASPGTGLVATSEVPEGGGVILEEHKLVVVQPTAGEFLAFSAVCTHEGCLVSRIAETIDCTCHNSKFSLTDGAPVEGPAEEPLAQQTVTVEGDQVALA